MSDITWEDVEGHAAHLSSIGLTAKADILAHVNNALLVSEFGGEDADKLRLARIYLAAHFGTLASNGGAVLGPITSQTVGPISRSYGATGVTDSAFSSTSWGQAYLQLVQTSPARLPYII